MSTIKLVLTNGNTYEVKDNSTITYMSLDVESFSDVATISKDINADNMKSVSLNDISYTEIIPTSFAAYRQDDGTVEVVIQARQKTFEEQTAEILSEHADALMELAGGLE